MALADEASSAFPPGAFQIMAATFQVEPRIAENFHSGAGME
jgi:hypothetical protein